MDENYNKEMAETLACYSEERPDTIVCVGAGGERGWCHGAAKYGHTSQSLPNSQGLQCGGA
jgi:hypothetical protein